jgi:hypothetical protein
VTDERNYRDAEPELMPGWFTGPKAQQWAEAWGVLKDVVAQAALEAVRAGFARWAPVDALRHIAAERSLERSPNDTEASWRAYLRTAWPTHEAGGGDQALIDAFARVGLTAYIRHNWQWDPDGTMADATKWPRLWIVVEHPSGLEASFDWDDGTTWDSGATWDVDGPSAEILAYLKRAIRKFKGSHVDVVKVYFLGAGTTWDDGLNAWVGGDVVEIDPNT